MRRCLAIATATAALLTAQTFAPTGTLTFEVASIRPTRSDEPHAVLRPAPGGRRYTAAGQTLRALLWVAYQVKPEQIAGGPGWLDTDRYDLNAEADKGYNIEDLHIMLQNLLTEKFKLRFHRATKQMAVYALTVDQGGPKNLKSHPTPSGGEVFLDQKTEELVHAKWTAHCASMDFFGWRLSRILDRPAINQTQLAGCYDFELTFTRELPPGFEEGQLFNGAPIDTYGPTIYQALRAQLGLKLESKKGPVDTMVIDHAERAAE